MSALPVQVEPRSTRGALGGAWLTSARVWAILLIPALALTAYQTSTDVYPSVLARALAIALPCLTPGAILLVARVLRRKTPTVPIALCLLYWVLVGTVHGLTAAWLAIVLSGSVDHYPAQAIFWAGSCLLWMPLVTYGVAQWADRGRLLETLRSDVTRNEAIRRVSLLELADLHDAIVGAIPDNIRPVLITISENLTMLGPAVNKARLAELGEQLADVSDETVRIIETTANQEQAHPPQPGRTAISPVRAALDFDRTRPLLSAGLGCAALLPLVVAISFRSATAKSDAFATDSSSWR